jgi:hypothetical protein
VGSSTDALEAVAPGTTCRAPTTDWRSMLRRYKRE